MLGLSHGPGIELAARLLELAPFGLTRVFYSDSGSTAVEVALKMAFQQWAHRGQPQRTKFVCLRNAYHGDTIGSVSVGGIDLFHSLYRPLLFDALQVEPGDVPQLVDAVRAHGDEIAAVIVEPLVQGAAGIIVQPDGFLRAVRAVTREHGIPLIVDEVATGFGRTGTMFACEQEGVTPDLLCLGKGLTGGYVPLAATLATEPIYEAFLGAFEELKTFFHGHTFTGNPLGCAAALASLDVFEREHTLERLQPKIALLLDLLERQVTPHPAVAEVRARGFMVGIELQGFALHERMGHEVTLAARRRGAIIRPLGDVVVLMPPLSIDEADLRRLVEITAAAIDDAAGGARSLACAA
jgi:adenosylmethionine---8-amino-7-oxononanoate aminotransferase